MSDAVKKNNNPLVFICEIVYDFKVIDLADESHYTFLSDDYGFFILFKIVQLFDKSHHRPESDKIYFCSHIVP